jgi:hypothetical protein
VPAETLSSAGRAVAAANEDEPFRPLVVGAPRSGFALLCSVVIHFVPMRPAKADLRQRVLNTVIGSLGDHIASQIVAEFARHGITGDLLYNPNFRLLHGGPKWLRGDKPGFAAFRKYIGVRGMGDFTLNTSHPREVLDADDVVHSHSDPGLWYLHPGYAGYVKYASVRNPIGIINSAVHSLNALASEYIQRFVPPDQDDDSIRRELALYKFTDLDFMDGLTRFLVKYLQEFVKHMERYVVMRWEDLILDPVPTVMKLAEAGGLRLTADQARQIWSRLDHVNLTGHHKHNYRAGKGIVGDWRNSIVNEHLTLFRERGLEQLTERLGYGPIVDLDEAEYTPFQRRVHEYLARGEVYREFRDPDLFTYAFNKSNIISDKFVFRRFPWRQWTQIERSCFANEALETAVWDVAEQATARFNELLLDLLEGRFEAEDDALRTTRTVRWRHASRWAAVDPRRYDEAFDRAVSEIERTFHAAGVPEARDRERPRLVETLEDYNVVAFQNTYYGLPQMLGDVRLDEGPEPEHEAIIKRGQLDEVLAAIRQARKPVN